MMCGAASFSIYQTYTPDQIAYVVGDAEARVVICEQAFLPQVLAAREQLPDVEHVVVIDGEAPSGTLALADVEGSGEGFDVEASVAAIEPEDTSRSSTPRARPARPRASSCSTATSCRRWRASRRSSSSRTGAA
jgi:long-subunit acyl-CoA synthetase (AMP-forming)